MSFGKNNKDLKLSFLRYKVVYLRL